jgi:hypothetical protein
MTAAATSNSIAIRERSQFATCPRSGARPDFRPVLFRSNVRGVENDRDWSDHFRRTSSQRQFVASVRATAHVRRAATTPRRRDEMPSPHGSPLYRGKPAMGSCVVQHSNIAGSMSLMGQKLCGSRVRFTPKSCRGCRRAVRPLWARSRLSALQQKISYSITSSAATRRPGGTVRPSAFAVLRLMTRR